MSRAFIWDTGRDVGGDGGASVETHAAGATLTSSDVGKFHYVNSASNLAFTLPQATAALVDKSIWFYKAGTGHLDINAYAGDNIEGETDIENTTTETYAIVCLKCTAVGEWSLVTLIGSWQ